MGELDREGRSLESAVVSRYGTIRGPGMPSASSDHHEIASLNSLVDQRRFLCTKTYKTPVIYLVIALKPQLVGSVI